MKLSQLFVPVLVALMLACGGGGGSASLSAPWDGMGLPNDQTNIIAQMDSSITMDVPGDPKSAGEAYEKAILANGWSSTAPLTMSGDMGGGVYSKDGKTLALSSSPSYTGGGAMISMSIN